MPLLPRSDFQIFSDGLEGLVISVVIREPGIPPRVENQ
jgi:hypothetical protein